jgi:hypothetical protein
MEWGARRGDAVPYVHVRFAPKSEHGRFVMACPLSADFVAKGVDGFREE